MMIAVVSAAAVGAVSRFGVGAGVGGGVWRGGAEPELGTAGSPAELGSAAARRRLLPHSPLARGEGEGEAPRESERIREYL
jgi:hypothetical protein